MRSACKFTTLFGGAAALRLAHLHDVIDIVAHQKDSTLGPRDWATLSAVSRDINQEGSLIHRSVKNLDKKIAQWVLGEEMAQPADTITASGGIAGAEAAVDAFLGAARIVGQQRIKDIPLNSVWAARNPGLTMRSKFLTESYEPFEVAGMDEILQDFLRKADDKQEERKADFSEPARVTWSRNSEKFRVCTIEVGRVVNDGVSTPVLTLQLSEGTPTGPGPNTIVLGGQFSEQPELKEIVPTIEDRQCMRTVITSTGIYFVAPWPAVSPYRPRKSRGGA